MRAGLQPGAPRRAARSRASRRRRCRRSRTAASRSADRLGRQALRRERRRRPPRPPPAGGPDRTMSERPLARMGADQEGRQGARPDHEQSRRIRRARWRAASAEAAAVRQSVSRVPSSAASGTPGRAVHQEIGAEHARQASARALPGKTVTIFTPEKPVGRALRSRPASGAASRRRPAGRSRGDGGRRRQRRRGRPRPRRRQGRERRGRGRSPSAVTTRIGQAHAAGAAAGAGPASAVRPADERPAAAPSRPRDGSRPAAERRRARRDACRRQPGARRRRAARRARPSEDHGEERDREADLRRALREGIERQHHGLRGWRPRAGSPAIAIGSAIRAFRTPTMVEVRGSASVRPSCPGRRRRFRRLRISLPVLKTGIELLADGHGLAGARVAAVAGIPLLDRKGAEAAKFHPVAPRQRVRDRVEDGGHDRSRRRADRGAGSAPRSENELGLDHGLERTRRSAVGPRLPNGQEAVKLDRGARSPSAGRPPRRRAPPTSAPNAAADQSEKPDEPRGFQSSTGRFGRHLALALEPGDRVALGAELVHEAQRHALPGGEDAPSETAASSSAERPRRSATSPLNQP